MGAAKHSPQPSPYLHNGRTWFPQLSRMPPFLGGFPRQRTQGCILSFWVNLLFRTITVKVQPSVSMATVRATWEIPPGSLKRDNPATTLNCPSVLVLVVITMEWTGVGGIAQAPPHAGVSKCWKHTKFFLAVPPIPGLEDNDITNAQKEASRRGHRQKLPVEGTKGVPATRDIVRTEGRDVWR